MTKENTAKAPKALTGSDSAQELSEFILDILDEHSAQDVIVINIKDKSSIADIMIIASGRSSRHVGALGEYVRRGLKESGYKSLGVEGEGSNDWILIDAGDVILHIFKPEVRAFYNIEKIWSVPLPQSLQSLSDDDGDAAQG